MKHLTTFILALICIVSFSQNNKYTCVITTYDYSNDTVINDTLTIDLTATRLNAQVNRNAVIFLKQFVNNQNIQNITTNLKVCYSVFSAGAYCDWGNTAVTELYRGGYIASGLDSNQVAIFRVYNSSDDAVRSKLILHMLHELDYRTSAAMDGLIGSKVYGIDSYTNEIKAGELIDHNQSLGMAYIINSNNTPKFVDWYSVTLFE